MLYQGLVVALCVALSHQSGNDDGYGSSKSNAGYGSAQDFYRGRYDGRCDADGFYYNDGGSFMMCSNGNAYEHRCAPGSRNSDFDNYSRGYRTFCDVNLVDYGYTLTHGNSGYGNQNSGYGSQNSGYGSQNSGYGNQNSGYGSQTSVHGSQNSGYGGNQNSVHGSQNRGSGRGFGGGFGGAFGGAFGGRFGGFGGFGGRGSSGSGQGYGLQTSQGYGQQQQSYH